MASPVKYFLSVIAGLDLAIEERDVRHKAEHDDYLLVIPQLDRGVQEIPGSRYACPRMTEEKIILSLPDLIRQSTNTRHWLTICT